MKKSSLLSALLVLAAAHAAAAGFFDVLPEVSREAGVPDLKSVIGVDWGSAPTDPEQVLAYARALAAAAPQRVRMLEYARSLEGRPLILVVVSAPDNLARVAELQSKYGRLSDPRRIAAPEAEQIVKELPAVVWLACSVHGDEASGGDAGLALAYHLASARTPEIEEMLKNVIVLIDPMQNPDGRARFVASTRAGRGAVPDAEPASAEHVQPWPGGRFSHDLFDLNRDWFALTHPESAGRVAAMLAWHPVVVADLHEMGADQGYYFAPPADPRNPYVSAEQAALWETLGKANAGAFDAQGWQYWTRELFDAFYPGYGESWPFFSGVVGMTFEEASSRGIVTRLRDDSELRYTDTVRRQLVAAYTTCRTSAANHERFVGAWFGYRQASINEGLKGATRGYVIEPGARPRAAAELADLLARQGVEVQRVTAAAAGIGAGSFIVPLDQPLGRLARVLLERHVAMGEKFEREQERRDSRRMEDQIYDITAWSLPLLWSVPARGFSGVPKGLAVEPVKAGALPAGTVTGGGKVAYLMRWQGTESAAALARLLRDGVKVRAAGKAFTLAGRRFERGALVVRTIGNLDKLREKLEAVAAETGVEFVGVDTGYVEDGIDIGSTSVRLIKPPRIALVWDTPTSPPSAGGLRYAIERIFGYPVTVLRTGSLAQAELGRFQVIVLPDAWGFGGGYSALVGETVIRRLASWVREGGVLVGIGEGAAFLCDEKVGLLAAKLEKRGGPDKEKDKDKAKPEATKDQAGEGEKPSDAGKIKAEAGAKPADKPMETDSAVKPQEERPPAVPGAILRVELDEEHFLSSGFPENFVDTLATSRRIFTPVKLDKGINVGLYAPADKLVESGFVLRASREQLPHKGYLMEQDLGRGKVIAFAEDPAFRGFTRATMVLLANALFFGPAF